MARTTPPPSNRAAAVKTATPPTLRSLLRLAGWGFCAALALGVTATLVQTERGAERVQQAVASLYTPEKPETARVPTPAVTVAEKTFDAEQETSRLASQLRTLSADRDQLAARVAMLERNFDDITGSVKQIATSRITPPAPAKVEAPKPEAAKPDAHSESKPETKAELPRLEPIKDQHETAKASSPPPSISAPAVIAAAPPPRPANDNQRPAAPSPRIAESAPAAQPAPPVVRLVPVPDKTRDDAAKEAAAKNPAAKDTTKDTASRHADTDTQLTTGSIPAKPEFAIDLGGASTVDALRALWDSTKAAHAPLLDKLQPAAILRPTGRNGTPQLRLMAGPFTEASTAAAVCRAFAQGRGTCRPFAYDGQKLPLR